MKKLSLVILMAILGFSACGESKDSQVESNANSRESQTIDSQDSRESSNESAQDSRESK